MNWGGPCILRSRDCRACSASGLRGESGTERVWKEEVDDMRGEAPGLLYSKVNPGN